MASYRYTAMTPKEREDWDRRQADERRKRGLVGFTRPERTTEVYGQTNGESALSRAQRRIQSSRRRRSDEGS